ncbi:unnamed protein product [Periconia digitata]|uniref:Uncharacterized protein n=1 Tax=Periconia digitata TaxID=1303443 RepID=A0A9W4XQJ1_9PLEO|nr:unnamed protein product [Periconia digitata]
MSNPALTPMKTCKKYTRANPPAPTGRTHLLTKVEHASRRNDHRDRRLHKLLDACSLGCHLSTKTLQKSEKMRSKQSLSRYVLLWGDLLRTQHP